MKMEVKPWNLHGDMRWSHRSSIVRAYRCRKPHLERSLALVSCRVVRDLHASSNDETFSPPLPSTPSFTSYFFLRCSQTWKPVDAPCAHNTRQYQFQYLFVKPAFKACANNTKKHLKGNKKKQKLPSFKASKNLGNTTWIKLETSNSKYFFNTIRHAK